MFTKTKERRKYLFRFGQQYIAIRKPDFNIINKTCGSRTLLQRFGCETIHPTQKFILMNLLQMS